DGPEDHPRAGVHGTWVDPAASDGVRTVGRRLPHGPGQGDRGGDASHGSDGPPTRRDLVLEETGVRRRAPASHADGRRPHVGRDVRQGPVGPSLGHGDDGRTVRHAAGRACPRCVQHRVQEPHGLRDVHVLHRSRREIPARDAASLPLRAHGRLDAMDAVPGGIVPPRGGRDPHEGERGCDNLLAGSDAAGVGYVYLPYDLHENLLTDRGKPIERGAYVDYLRTVLPDRYMSSRHWEFVKEEFLFNEKWGTPEAAPRG